MFGRWHTGMAACLIPAGKHVTQGELHLTFVCLLSLSPLLEPTTLVDEDEIISMCRVLSRHPADL